MKKFAEKKRDPAQNPLRISSKSAQMHAPQNKLRICSEFVQNLLRSRKELAENPLRICLDLLQNLVRICTKSAQNSQKLHVF